MPMIRLTCPGCGKKLRAKPELLGQTRSCPKCGTPVRIVAGGAGVAAPGPQSASLAAAAPPEVAAQGPAAAEQVGLPVHHWPERLERQHHYLVCDRAKIVAAWQNNGEGWLLWSTAGWIPAARNRDQLPTQGAFQLVELKLETTDAGRHLAGIAVYQLAARWALTSLDKGDDAILGKITGLGCLNRDQKGAVRAAIKDQFMHQVWEHADAVWEYLGNTDYHSPGTG